MEFSLHLSKLNNIQQIKQLADFILPVIFKKVLKKVLKKFFKKITLMMSDKFKPKILLYC